VKKNINIYELTLRLSYQAQSWLVVKPLQFRTRIKKDKDITQGDMEIKNVDWKIVVNNQSTQTIPTEIQNEDIIMKNYEPENVKQVIRLNPSKGTKYKRVSVIGKNLKQGDPILFGEYITYLYPDENNPNELFVYSPSYEPPKIVEVKAKDEEFPLHVGFEYISEADTNQLLSTLSHLLKQNLELYNLSSTNLSTQK